MRQEIERLEAYHSQKEIARRLHVHPRTLRKWKTGKTKPTKAHKTTMGRMLGGLRAKGTKRAVIRQARRTREGVLSVRKSHEEKIDAYAQWSNLTPDEEMEFGISGNKEYFDGMIINVIRDIFYSEPNYKFFKKFLKWSGKSGNKKFFPGIQIGLIYKKKTLLFDREIGLAISETEGNAWSIALPSSEWMNEPEPALYELVKDLVQQFIHQKDYDKWGASYHFTLSIINAFKYI